MAILAIFQYFMIEYKFLICMCEENQADFCEIHSIS